MDTNNGSRFLYFIAGIGIGALAGVLFAPRSGKETRQSPYAHPLRFRSHFPRHSPPVYVFDFLDDTCYAGDMNFKGMSTKQRDMYAKSSLELANIVAGALVFGQFISGRSVDGWIFAAGIIVTLGLHIGAYYFSKEDGSKVS